MKSKVVTGKYGLWIECSLDKPSVGREHVSATLWCEDGWEAEYAAAFEHIVPRLHGRAFHATTDAGFASIVRDARILPNQRTGDYKTLRPATSNRSWASYSAAKGYVSILDSLASREVLAKPHWQYWRPAHEMEDFPGNKAVAYLLLLRADAESELIRRHYLDVWNNEPVGSHFAMEGECWYPGPVPIEAIESVLQVEWRNMRDPELAALLEELTPR